MKKITFLIFVLTFSFLSKGQELITDGGFENTVSSGYTVSESSANVLKRVTNIYDPGTNNCQATFPTTTAAAVVAGQWVKKTANATGDDGVKAIVQATGAHGGTNCLNLKIASGIATTGYTNWSNCVALQKVNSSLSNTNKYVVTFWAKLDGTASNNATSVTVILVDNTAKVVTNPLAATAVLTGGTTWTKYTVLLDIPKLKSYNSTADFTTAFLGFGIYTSYSTNTNYSGVLIDDISLQQYSGTPSTRYVKSGGTGDGTTWGNASGNIIDMLNDIPAGEVRVAAGTYTPSATIPIKDGINLTGAYAADDSGTRDLYANQTILDGATSKRILQAPDYGAAFYNVTTVDGFTLQRGASTYGSAAALTIGAVLQNCIIRNNNGGSYGAAVFFSKNTYASTSNVNGKASGALINCIIHNNTSSTQAGAVFCGDYAYCSLINCLIASNKCTTGVGGVYYSGSNAIAYQQIQNSIFYNNSGSTYNNLASAVSSTAMQIVLNNYFDDVAIPVSGAYTLHANSVNNKTKTDFSTPNFANPTSLQGYDAGNSSNTTLITGSDWRLTSSSGLIGLGNSTQGVKFPYENMNASASATTTKTYSSISTDIMGSTRVLNTTVEMGAYEYNPFTISLSSASATQGSVSGGATVSKGSSITVTATPAGSFTFLNWTENGTQVSTNAAYTFTVTAARTLVANFVPYIIAVSSNDNAMGSVSGGGNYASGASVSLTATPNSGYRFVNWTEGGNSVSTSTSYTFNASANRTLVANFVLIQTYTVGISANDNNMGSVSGGGTFDSGTSMSLTATANSGYRFVNWTESGTPVSSSSPYAFSLLGNRTLVANFVQAFTIAASANDAAMGSVSGANTYDSGSSVSLVATAITGFHFVNWTENGSSISTSASLASFNASANRTLVANFALTDPLTFSNFEGTSNSGNNWSPTYVYTGSYSIVTDPDNSGNKVLLFNRGTNDNQWSGPQWSGSVATAPILMTGVNIGSSTATQFRYLVVRAKKSTAYSFQANFQLGLNGASNVSATSSTTVNSGSWTTYVFDFAAANGTYKLLYLAPENGGNKGAVSTYLDDIYFTNNPPVIATLDATTTATSITVSSASSGGNITADGGLSITARGICWSTSQNPTISDSKTSNGTGIGSFTSSITGLSPNTTYYVRAYATNNVGTNYGVQISFTTVNEFTVNSNTSSSALSTLNSSSTVTVLSGNTFTVDNVASIGTLTVAPGAKLTLNSGQTLTAGTLTLQSDASNGTATLVDNGGTLLAAATVEQYLTGGRNWYFTSPVTTANSNVITSTSGNLLWAYSEPDYNWNPITVTDAALSIGSGYVANLVTDGTISFNGTLNTGNQSVSLIRTENGKAKRGFNLIGNPYPSYLDPTSVINSASEMENTVWYRIKVSATYHFETINTTSGIGTNNSGAGAVTKFIPPMQAFWVRVAPTYTAKTLTFTNAMRSHEAGTNRLRVKELNSQQIVRLQVSNGISSDEAVLYSDPNASNSYDAYDSQKMTNSIASIPEIYTLAGTEQFAINGLNVIPYDIELPIGFTSGQAGTNFSIKTSQFSNLEQGIQILLHDNILNKTQDLALAEYNFSSDAVSTSTRFTLTFRAPSIATGINSEASADVWISGRNGQLMINGAPGNGAKVEVFNAVGQKIISENLNGSNHLLNNDLAAGAYLVKLTIAGKTITKKVIID